MTLKKLQLTATDVDKSETAKL